MATTRPHNVFLDSNVVIRAGKPPGGPLIARLVDLVEAGYVKIVTTDLTRIEIAKKHASNDFEIIGELSKKRVRALAHSILQVELPEISAGELHEKLLDTYNVSVADMFKKLRAVELSINNVIPLSVFHSYARKSGIFAGDAKKEQFPDAFIFETIRVIAAKDDPLTIVSDDSDFDAAIRGAEHITRLNSIPDLFSKLGLTIETAPDVDAFVMNNRDSIIDTVNDELNQFGLQVYNVEDAEIDEASVEDVTFSDLITFRTARPGKEVLVVGRVEMDVKVSYRHPDWDTATWDNEDRVAIPHRNVEGERNITVEADFNMTLNVDSGGKPTSISEFTFNDDNFMWVSIAPNDLDYK